MKIEILAIGEEILKGNTVNSNAAFLGKSLQNEGYSVFRHHVITDKKEEIVSALDEILVRSDCLIITGGLGPTLDDITKETVASYFQKKLVFDEKLYHHLQQTFSPHPSLKEQATVPNNTQILDNLVGSAPGFVFSQGSQKIVLLPGVPFEMEKMWQEKTLPLFFTVVSFAEKKMGKRVSPLFAKGSRY